MTRVLVLLCVFLVWPCLAGLPSVESPVARAEPREAPDRPGNLAAEMAEGQQASSPPGGLQQGVPDLLRASVQVLIALFGVLACLGAGVMVARRYMNSSARAGHRGFVRVLATGYLGPRKGIYIVEVAGRILVLGVTSTEITFLTSLEDREAVERLIKDRGRLPGAPSIAQWLERLWRKGRLDDMSARPSSAVSRQVELP